MSSVHGFDKPVLSNAAVSFDMLRTNGCVVEGLNTNGIAKMIAKHYTCDTWR